MVPTIRAIDIRKMTEQLKKILWKSRCNSLECTEQLEQLLRKFLFPFLIPNTFAYNNPTITRISSTPRESQWAQMNGGLRFSPCQWCRSRLICASLTSCYFHVTWAGDHLETQLHLQDREDGVLPLELKSLQWFAMRRKLQLQIIIELEGSFQCPGETVTENITLKCMNEVQAKRNSCLRDQTCLF